MTTANIDHVKRYVAKGSLEQRSALLDRVIEGVGKEHPEQLMLIARSMAVILNTQTKGESCERSFIGSRS